MDKRGFNVRQDAGQYRLEQSAMRDQDYIFLTMAVTLDQALDERDEPFLDIQETLPTGHLASVLLVFKPVFLDLSVQRPSRRIIRPFIDPNTPFSQRFDLMDGCSQIVCQDLSSLYCPQDWTGVNLDFLMECQSACQDMGLFDTPLCQRVNRINVGKFTNQVCDTFSVPNKIKLHRGCS